MGEGVHAGPLAQGELQFLQLFADGVGAAQWMARRGAGHRGYAGSADRQSGHGRGTHIHHTDPGTAQGRLPGDQHLDAGRPVVGPHPGHRVRASRASPVSLAAVRSPRGNTSARNMVGPAGRHTSPTSSHPQERSDARVG